MAHLQYTLGLHGHLLNAQPVPDNERRTRICCIMFVCFIQFFLFESLDVTVQHMQTTKGNLEAC